MPLRSVQQSFRILFVFFLFLAGISGPLSSAAWAHSYVFGTGESPALTKEY